MKVDFYLVVGSNGSIRTVKTRPGLNWNEIAISTSLELPDMLFKKPAINAKIIVPDALAQPHEITSEVINNAKDAIEKAVGMEVKITIGVEGDE